jgi:hypothetical protein
MADTHAASVDGVRALDGCVAASTHTVVRIDLHVPRST